MGLVSQAKPRIFKMKTSPQWLNGGASGGSGWGGDLLPAVSS